MLFTDSVYVGIDPTSGRKAFTYAALDRDLNLIALADADLEELTAFLGGQRAAVVAVNGPSAINRGLVRKKLESESLTPGLHQIRGAEMRLAEYELRERGISVSGTPGRADLCPAWMQFGFQVYARLAKLGFQELSAGEGADYRWLETHPHACFCVLLEQIPLPKPTLEGRLQRQLALFERGLRIKDPMDFFEEITRFKLVKGILPTEQIYPAEILDVLAAGYTAWLAANKPEQVTSLGNASEGLIVLPAKEIKSKY
ncbi:MAG TPA: DUF429 domain-containing protein [Anaerolineales bacterium]|jgi:hypothetical protein